MIVSRSRTVAAEPEAVWSIVADPKRLARWWPRTERVKGVTGDGWTTVMRSARGRAVRADWRLEREERPVRRAWTQQLEGTPFAKVLRDWVSEQLGAIARPDDIRFANNLPKTRSGKIMRRLLRAIARNEDITQDLSTLENPSIIDQLRGVESAPAAAPAQKSGAPRPRPAAAKPAAKAAAKKAAGKPANKSVKRVAKKAAKKMPVRAARKGVKKAAKKPAGKTVRRPAKKRASPRRKK